MSIESETYVTKWQFWIDRGGTFTDIVAQSPQGLLLTHKLLSDNPCQYPDAAVAGIRHLLGLKPHQAIGVDQVECVKMGTTVATNALLEKKGEPTLLVTTKGFKDALRIAYQNRPRLFDRHIVLPELLYSQVIEASERMGAHGDVIQALDENHLRQQMQLAFNAGLKSVAIVFLHAYRYTAHEIAAANIAKQIGFSQISTSHQTSPLMKLISRGDTTVVDAYLSPILNRYVNQVAQEMPGVPLYFMQSSGGLTDAHAFQGKDAILSGPAGGIVGMARTAEQAFKHAQGLSGPIRVIGFDMGGTSTDVSHYAGEFEREFETQVAGVRMRVPMMSIHTVAAGGGSLLQFDGSRFRVGPQSAGANPGPASYRRGGPLAVTDANVMLGKIQPNYFPHVFGDDAQQALDKDIVEQKFNELAHRISQRTAKPTSATEVAEGFIQIAVAQMANAIKKISVSRGYDVTQYTLQCFGGAGGQHACGVADALGMTHILVHPLAGVLSAYGMGLADQSVMREQAVEKKLDIHSLTSIQSVFQQLAIDAKAQLKSSISISSQSSIQLIDRIHLRYEGSDTAMVVPFGDIESIEKNFEIAYQKRFAFLMPNKALMVEAVSVEATIATPFPETAVLSVTQRDEVPVREMVKMFSSGQWYPCALVVREDMQAGDRVMGPAIIAEQNATTVVEDGWKAQLTSLNHLVLKRIKPRETRHAVGTQVDPVLLEVFNHLFMNIAEQMGLQLQNTAHSVNIKERLDFSCAIFNQEGHLIANAPHMPVHLGSMGESIQTVIANNKNSMKPGDVYVLNDPYHGGTHLPDVTVITPVYLEGHAEPSFYMGSRGHHADIGGLTPGSMPPFSTHIEEEGVQIQNFKLLDAGVLQEEKMLALLRSGKYPSRNPAQNMADLQAQIAANEKGVQELQGMVQQYSLPVVQAYMKHVQDNAEESVRRAITQLAHRWGHNASKKHSFVLRLDNRAQIQVAIQIDAQTRTAQVDFSGTSVQQSNNFNAPKAVCMAAVLYVFRTLVDDDIPLNAGCLKPITVNIPQACMLNPLPPASVVAGNVETSSCITNALYGALGVMAGSQPTMNNFTFGNARYQYYETISGGSGAGPLFDTVGAITGGFAGTSVVQTHMTNSRLTDPEVLEFRFPVRLLAYDIRHGSGGAGLWSGGDGGIRRVQFLDPMTASMLSNGRVYPAFGLDGGKDGMTGINRVIRVNGSIETLGHIAQVQMQAGDIFEIQTPGGGGYGE
ncbi:MAG: 5-oxoprolinase [Limnohabitans sp.]|nr:5-oxoprolinase [Limnohabitans sp.]